MQRFFGQIKDKEAFLSLSDAHHLVDVVRIKEGEEVEVVSEKDAYLCLVSSTKPLVLKVVEKLEEKRELDNEVILAFALLKGDHNDLIVQKGTELGASSFIPFTGARTIVKVDSKIEDGRLERLRRIAKEASQQCHRPLIPEVNAYETFEEVLKIQADYKFFCYESLKDDASSLLEAAKDIKKGQKALVVVGPEGGFTEKEAQKAKEAGFLFVSLGRRILRGETACITSIALLAALSERE